MFTQIFEPDLDIKQYFMKCVRRTLSEPSVKATAIDKN